MENITRIKYNIEKPRTPIQGIYNYNVQVLISIDGGKSFDYVGYGKYCKTINEVHEYIKEYESDRIHHC